MIEHDGTVVLGGGVVGLACARALAQAGEPVLLLEAEPALGQGISSRSSEVIHAGLYYPEDSLKAALCCRGRELLYAYCAARGVGHRKLGKLVVAADASGEGALETLRDRGARLGVPGLACLTGAELKRRAPALTGAAALWSPETGIVDSHGLLQALAGDAAAAGAELINHTTVVRLEAEARGLVLLGTSAGEPLALRAPRVVNAAGFGAFALAQGLGAADAAGPFYAAGHYFSYSGQVPVDHLVYPLPEAGGLGIHLTFDLAGQARFGPDVCWRAAEDYGFRADRRRFAEAIQSYFPGLEPARLQPAYVGLRPKRGAQGAAAADFGWVEQAFGGETGVLHLLGIESPGLTSALALGERVAARWEGGWA